MYYGIESIVRGNSAACIEAIFKIHFPTAKTALDCTFGAGRFWKWGHALNITGIDIDPPECAKDDPRLIIADYRTLPFLDGSFDVMCFDPMFLFSRGILAISGTQRQFMGAEAVNYGGRTWSKQIVQHPKNPADLQEHYRCIFEQRKIARGLICKGQDLVVSRNRDYWSVNTINLARDMGLGFPTDILYQQSPAARLKDPRWKVQRMFRTALCQYLIWKFE